MKTKKSRKENLEDLIEVLAKHNAPSLLVLEIANVMKDIDDEFKVQDFRNKVDELRPNDHDHGTGGKPYEKACIPAVQEFVRFWIDDMQKEYNVFNFHTWRVMIAQFKIAIEILERKDAIFMAEVDKNVERSKEEDVEYRKYTREHWGVR